MDRDTAPPGRERGATMMQTAGPVPVVVVVMVGIGLTLALFGPPVPSAGAPEPLVTTNVTAQSLQVCPASSRGPVPLRVVSAVAFPPLCLFPPPPPQCVFLFHLFHACVSCV